MSEEQSGKPSGHSPEGAEKIMPYASGKGSEAKGKQVETMFDSIAPAYDLMNTVMTFGMHTLWRDRALKMAISAIRKSLGREPADILDVATGTGDVIFALHKRLPQASLCGIDLSEGMLDIARRKLRDMGGEESGDNPIAMPEDKAGSKARRMQSGSKIEFIKGDSLALPFADDSFDMITVAYGVRNFENAFQGYSEMRRVLRPGGVLCVIELCEPENPLMLAGYKVYTRGLIPLAGRIVSGDARAYSYLHESIEAAPQREAMCEIMRKAGFSKALWRTYFPGVICAYLGI